MKMLANWENHLLVQLDLCTGGNTTQTDAPKSEALCCLKYHCHIEQTNNRQTKTSKVCQQKIKLLEKASFSDF